MNWRRKLKAPTAMFGTAAAVLVLIWGGTSGLGVASASPHPPKSESKSSKSRGSFLGIYMQTVDDDLAEAMDLGTESGVLVDDVVDDGPAEAAGLESGDVIVEFDGSEVEDASDLRRILRKKDPGEEVVCVVLRDGKKKTITVELGERDRGEFAFIAPGDDDMEFLFAGQGAQLGVSTHDVGKELGKYFKTDEGVLVLEVHDESAASEAGIEIGDVIVQVGEESVEDTESLREVLGEYEEGEKVDVVVMRSGRKKTLEVELDAGGWGSFAHRWNVAPRVRIHERLRPPRGVYRFDSDEIEELREELRELREELEKLKED